MADDETLAVNGNFCARNATKMRYAMRENANAIKDLKATAETASVQYHFHIYVHIEYGTFSFVKLFETF